MILKRILLIEDEEGWRKRLKPFVEDAISEVGIPSEIVEMEDFNEVLRSLDKDQPWDLVIADLGLLPWQNQFFGANAIAHAHELNIPAIGISGQAIPDHVELSLDSKNIFYLRKENLDRNNFIDIIKSILRGGKKGPEYFIKADLHLESFAQRKLTRPDTKALLAILCRYARSHIIGPKNFFIDLIDDTNWPQEFKDMFNKDLLSGDPRHDAKTIIRWAEGRGINPNDKRFTTLGSLLEALLDQPLGYETTQFITALISIYDLYRTDDLKAQLRENYKIPVFASSIQASEINIGPEIDWIGPADTELENWLVPEPDLLDVGFLMQAIKAASSVCKVELFINGANLMKSQGTGVLISSKLLLTNFHVLQPANSDTNIQANTENITLHFGVFSKSNGISSPGMVFKLDSHDPILAFSPSDQLDFALLNIEDEILKFEEIQPTLWRTECTLRAHESINILQHPEGFPMQLAISKDGITNILDNKGWLQYVSNTSFGSSGSPCFNDHWELVALHHAQRKRGIYSIREGILFGAIYEKIKHYLS